MDWDLLFRIYVFLFLLHHSFQQHDEEFYIKVFEEVDPDSILDNERLLRAYVNCFLDKGPCSIHAQLVKESIPETLETVCGYCNAKQKGIFKYALNKFISLHPKDWENIQNVYDPDRKFWPGVEAFLKS